MNENQNKLTLPSYVKTVNPLQYLTSVYFTKSAPVYLACFKDPIRKRTVAQQINSSLSDRPVYYKSNITALNREPCFRIMEYRIRRYKLIQPFHLRYYYIRYNSILKQN